MEKRAPVSHREATETAVRVAAIAWAAAPLHVRVMAGEYVNPLMDALHAMDLEFRRVDLMAAAVDALEMRVKSLEARTHG